MKITILALTLILSLLCMAGCAQSAPAEDAALSSGGVLVLRVNPEIAVEYDESGLVTAVTARNNDAMAIITACDGLIGQQTRTAVTELVSAIGEAGYFVEEVEGEARQIVIEIEAGSSLPHDDFLDDVVSDVRACVSDNNWAVPTNVENESDYGLTDYVDTDYGPGSDGVTDYDDTDYGPGSDGVTDYDDTDYGPNNDGVTDYDDTDYGPNNDGVTDYDGTDYGPNSDGVTDYDDTDYGPNSDGVTDYDGGNSDYAAPPATSPPATNPPVNSGNSDYGDSSYGSSDYGDSSSDYGDSDYD